MRRRIWAGVLPRYWTESPWCAAAGEELLLLVPEGDRRVLMKVTPNGGVVWKQPTHSRVLIAVGADRVLTSRVRDGRSDAVYFQFTAHDAATGQLMWQLGPEVAARRPKSITSPFLIDSGGQLLVQLDTWRDVHTGAPSDSSDARRGAEVSRATYVLNGDSLSVTWQGHSWELTGSSTIQLQGIKGSVLVGCDNRRLWARTLSEGALKWEVDLDDGVVDPSGQVGGLDEQFHSAGGMVPVAAVMLGERAGLLREAPAETVLYELPDGRRVESWEVGAMVALVGAVGGGYLVVEENNDGTGCMWFAQ